MDAGDTAAVERVYASTCADFVRARKECWQRSLLGKDGEECLREELLEKRCLAHNFCPRQAKRYYGAPGAARKGRCASWAEAFAFGPNDDQAAVNGDPRLRKKCRKAAFSLATCLSEFTEPFNYTDLVSEQRRV